MFLKDIAEKVPHNESAISNMSKKISRELDLTLALPQPSLAEVSYHTQMTLMGN